MGIVRHLAAARQGALRLLALFCFLGVTAAAVAATAAVWPVIAIPERAQSFKVGEQMGLNGVPMRVEAFLIDDSPEHVAEWFRHSLGDPLNESAIGKKLILGRPKEGFYLTVQLDPAGTGTRGIVAVSDIKAALGARSEARQLGNRWQSRLPAGSRVLSQSSSEDGGRISSQIVFANRLPAELNRDRIDALMADDGYVLERDTEVADGRHFAASVVGSHVMRFKGGSKEATAVITRLQDGRTAVVLSTVTQFERMQ